MQRARQSLVIGARDLYDLARFIHLDLDEAMMGKLQFLALGAFDKDLAVGDLDLDAGRDGHGLFADSRHDFDSLPNRTQQFAAQSLRAGLAITHDALAG